MPELSNRGHLLTELVNPRSHNLDQLSPLELVQLFNREDQEVLKAIAASQDALAEAIALTAEALKLGGRLFYIGAGTSGRLGVLDAAECPPTFFTSPTLVQGIIAGGREALVKSSEALEDRAEDGAAAILAAQISSLDVVIGITAGGTTPFVQGALAAAKQIGAKTIFLTCVPKEQVELSVDLDIRLLTGPELLAGSTRLKAGTATKMALNIISTGVMVQLGKVYGNRMVDVAVTNSKLHDRAVRMVMELTDLEPSSAQELLEQSGKRVKLAILMHQGKLTKAAGEALLIKHQGLLRRALEEIKNV